MIMFVSGYTWIQRNRGGRELEKRERVREIESRGRGRDERQ